MSPECNEAREGSVEAGRCFGVLDCSFPGAAGGSTGTVNSSNAQKTSARGGVPTQAELVKVGSLRVRGAGFKRPFTGGTGFEPSQSERAPQARANPLYRRTARDLGDIIQDTQRPFEGLSAVPLQETHAQVATCVTP